MAAEDHGGESDDAAPAVMLSVNMASRPSASCARHGAAKAGYGDGDVAHAAHIDARHGGCIWPFAGGPQRQAEWRSVEHKEEQRQRQPRQIGQRSVIAEDRPDPRDAVDQRQLDRIQLHH
ncbi:MAG: hypothetical protein R3E51_02590 [Rhizobiaceae bacterium]